MCERANLPVLKFAADIVRAYTPLLKGDLVFSKVYFRKTGFVYTLQVYYFNFPLAVTHCIVSTKKHTQKNIRNGPHSTKFRQQPRSPNIAKP